MDTSLLAPMLGALALANESARESHAVRGAVFGVAQRWSFQGVASIPGITVAADADLVDRYDLVRASDLPLETRLNNAELIARLYLRYSTDFLKLLHGSFSLALWDENEQRLILAIDRLGIRSLYWCREEQRVLFASRPGAIRSSLMQATSVNPRAVLQFLLFAAVPAPLTIDRDLAKLCPGTALIFEAGRVAVRKYWDLEYRESGNRSVKYWSREVREGMRASVHRHLEGCEAAQTGCYLSGGTDSSSVVAFVSEKHTPSQSFSIAFQEAGFSEIGFARTTASLFRTRHYEKWLVPEDASDALDKIISFYDEPLGNSSAIGSYYCAKLAREHGVNTLLAGDGGDELFGGNERYAHDKYFALYHTLPSWLRHGLIEPLVPLLPEKGVLSLPRKYVRRANIPNPRRILSYGFFLSVPPTEIFETDFLDAVGLEDWLAIPGEHFRTAKAASELNRILYLDVKMTLADNDLRKVSGTAELAGVNVRYPLLDDRLVDLSGCIPAALKLRGFQKRYIFKQAMKGILPDKVLYKPKHGFGVPLAQWLLREPRMRELVNDIMHDPKTRQRGYFRSDFFETLLKLHKEQPNFYGEILWYLLALELWHRKHLERSRDVAYAI